MNIAKNTAERMLQNIERELQQLAQQQQQMNGNVGGAQSYKCGGKVKRRKMPWGDYVEDPTKFNGKQGTYNSATLAYSPGEANVYGVSNQTLNNLGYTPYGGIGSSMSEDNSYQTTFNGQPGTYNSRSMPYQPGSISIAENRSVGNRFRQSQPSINNRFPGLFPNQFQGVHKPGITSGMLGMPNWWNNFGSGSPQTPTSAQKPAQKKVALPNMATDPRFGSFTSAEEFPDRVTAPNKFGIGNIKMPNLGGETSVNAQNLYNNLESPSLAKGPMSGANRPGASGSAMDWMGMLPGIFNLGAGLMSGKAQRLNPNQFQNQYADQALSMMPDQYRIDPQLNEAKNAYANNIRNVNNAGNSRGEMMANYGAGMNQYNATIAGAYADKNNQENQMRMNKAGMMNQIGQQRAGVNLEVQNMNDQNAAASRGNRMSYLGNAAGDFQKNYLIQKQMANQQASQQAYINAMLKNPHWKQWLDINYDNPLRIQKQN
jgi:hypothetical protein